MTAGSLVWPSSHLVWPSPFQQEAPVSRSDIKRSARLERPVIAMNFFWEGRNCYALHAQEERRDVSGSCCRLSRSGQGEQTPFEEEEGTRRVVHRALKLRWTCRTVKTKLLY